MTKEMLKLFAMGIENKLILYFIYKFYNPAMCDLQFYLNIRVLLIIVTMYVYKIRILMKFFLYVFRFMYKVFEEYRF